ncbi:P-loop containing nucleoside triphosphate hydrolase protein [Rhizoclosmatium globosum]|uniref:p-loop containing nucleoside triphosphate hydrolase protein n=1 Tax=Rhizoclosmatium globosum TaxID=329046 RepID=A0A1Y2BZE9_9FUNG|nr:P-loop containing nucleoside triphosphate hydrolase protein [Rhizoclosmatium globosum]|eukprot:ORY40141.1 P-loop containing nucleoside triphosphate hydrolase protein [Rhizoclosmatium globosum]
MSAIDENEEFALPEFGQWWDPLNYITSNWVYNVLKGNKEKAPSLDQKHKADNTIHWLDTFMAQSRKPSGQRQGTLLGALLPHVLMAILLDALCQLILVSSTISLSLLLREARFSLILHDIVLISCQIQILRYLNPTFPRSDLFIQNGYGLAGLMFVLQLAIIWCGSFASKATGILQTQLKAGITSAIYKKHMHLSFKSKGIFPREAVNNLILADVINITNCVSHFNKVWTIPVQTGLSLYLVSQLLEVSSLVSALVFIALSLWSFIFSPHIHRTSSEYLKLMDERLVRLRSFWHGAKSVKYRSLEDNVKKDLDQARAEQIQKLKGYVSSYSLLLGSTVLEQQVVIPLTFLIYAGMGHPMTADIIFPSLSFLSSLSSLAGSVPQLVTDIILGHVSYIRISDFLLAEESDSNETPLYLPALLDSKEPAIRYENTSFSWPSKDTNASDIRLFSDLSFTIKRGETVAVVGGENSGRSSLIASLAGVMRKTGGIAELRGSVAYCSSAPFILSGSVQDNLTLLSNATTANISKAMDTVQLDTSLGSKVSYKDLTEDQKARISLARAIAFDADIYLLDKAFRSVAADLEAKIFDESINGHFIEKTVVFATTLLHHLESSRVDRIIVLDEGKIVEMGTYIELMSDLNGAFYKLMEEYELERAEVNKNARIEFENGQQQLTAIKDRGIDIDDNITAPRGQFATVRWGTYKTYATTAGWKYVILHAFMIAVLLGVYVAKFVILQEWTADSKDPQKNASCIAAYSALLASGTLVDFFGFILLTQLCLRAAQHFHNCAQDRILSAPYRFFNPANHTTIKERLRTDVTHLDRESTRIITGYYLNMYSVFGILIVVCISAWQIIPITTTLVLLCLALFRFTKQIFRQIHHLAQSANPLSKHISTIHCKEAIRSLNVPDALFSTTAAWMAFRIGVMCGVVEVCVLLFAVAGVMAPTWAGVAISQVRGLGQAMTSWLMSFASLDGNMGSAESLLEVANTTETESPRTLPNDAALPQEWPTTGSILFQNVLLYGETNDAARFNFEINPGEKIGVIGRSGGEIAVSLVDTLFRLNELAAGSVIVDGQDISELGLKKLRQSLVMIPQSPILMQGTLRANMDPDGRFTDTEIWSALETVGMKEKVPMLDMSISANLEQSPRHDGGVLFSDRDAQLIFLAIGILGRVPKVVVVEQSVKTGVSRVVEKLCFDPLFKDTTVLCVVHRLKTIAFLDRVLVVDDAGVVEFDTPKRLLTEKRGSEFASMVESAGDENSRIFRKLLGV